MTRLAGLVSFLALISWPALAGTDYILEVNGNSDSLQAVVTSNQNFTLQRLLFTSPTRTVGVVSVTGASASSNQVSTMAQVASGFSLWPDTHLPGVPAQVPTFSKGITSLQAWLLSLQNAQQKTNSYLTQSAFNVVNSSYGKKGAGVTVAVIDTAVDPTHPALAGKLLPAVDCVGSANCGGNVLSILADPLLDQSTVIILDQSTVIILDQSTVIILDQSTVIILDGNSATGLQGKQLPGDLGHGTMVASLISATAPGAKILPIRAFNADGSSNLSDVLAAIYYAVNSGAKVINMSFSLDTPSDALTNAINYASSQGVVCVASTANSSSNKVVYPAAYGGSLQNVLGVGSVDSLFGLFRSGFSGYGQPSVDVYAPGENLIAAYPGNHYAVASGTSFATAVASGVAAIVESGKSTTQDNLNDFVNALTQTGTPVFFPYDGTRVVNAKTALKTLN